MFISVTTSSILIESSNFCLSLHHTCNDTVSWIFKKILSYQKVQYRLKDTRNFRSSHYKIHRKTTVPEPLFIKKENLAQKFSCELCDIFNNTFFTVQLNRLLLKF